MLCIYGIWMLHSHRKDREGGWLKFRGQIDWTAVGDLVEFRCGNKKVCQIMKLTVDRGCFRCYIS